MASLKNNPRAFIRFIHQGHFLFPALMCFINMSAAQTRVQIYFSFNSARIDKKTEEPLRRLIAVIKKTDGAYMVRISGNCDSKGSDAYNDFLSEKRAKSANEFLVSNGIPPANIEPVKAWGKRKPLNKNVTEKDRQANRRVDVQYEVARRPDNNTLAHHFDSAKEGMHIVLPQLNFYGGMHKILPESKPVLDTLLRALKKNPKMKIRVEGHVCCTINGADGEDLETHITGLSVARAKEVYKWLIDHGIEQGRLSYRGMAGKYHLIDPEDTEEAMIKNRRVEVVVVSM
jgi:outer membrane protein OmpA-like peptidoglycan-associated protein